MTDFSLELIQAINDWQTGGNSTKKGERLKSLAARLPDRFRACRAPCYRQEAHEKDRLWQLLAEDHLPERIAGWSLDQDVARTFKGGVPPSDKQGVIFRILPPPESVVLNLAEIYSDADFLIAVDRFKGEVYGFQDGIGRYGGGQAEVILELPSLNGADLFSCGGFLGTQEQLAREAFGRVPSEGEMRAFDEALVAAAKGPGDQWWLSEEGTRNVLSRIAPELPRLREKRRRELEGGNSA